MSNKKKLKAQVKRLKIKLRLQTSDSIVANGIAAYQAHFAERKAETLAKENAELRAQLKGLVKPGDAKDLFEIMKTGENNVGNAREATEVPVVSAVASSNGVAEHAGNAPGSIEIS